MEPKRNLLVEVLAIKDPEAQRAFVRSLSDTERAEMVQLLGVALVPVLRQFEEFMNIVHDSLVRGCEILTAFAESGKASEMDQSGGD